MTAYVVLTREKTHDKDALAAYAKSARGAAAGHPMKVLAAWGKHEALEGPALEGAVVLEFATMEAAKNWYESPAYRAAREHRFKGADFRVFIVEGL